MVDWQKIFQLVKVSRWQKCSVGISVSVAKVIDWQTNFLSAIFFTQPSKAFSLFCMLTLNTLFHVKQLGRSKTFSEGLLMYNLSDIMFLAVSNGSTFIPNV